MYVYIYIYIYIHTHTHTHTHMFREQKAGQNLNIKIANKFSEMAEQFTNLETTLTNQNCLQEEIKSKLK